MFQVILKGVASNSTRVSRVFERSSKVCQGSFDGVSRKFPRIFKNVLRKFQEYFNIVSWVFQGRLNDVSSEFSVGFKGN